MGSGCERIDGKAADSLQWLLLAGIMARRANMHKEKIVAKDKAGEIQEELERIRHGYREAVRNSQEQLVQAVSYLMEIYGVDDVKRITIPEGMLSKPYDLLDELKFAYLDDWELIAGWAEGILKKRLEGRDGYRR